MMKYSIIDIETTGGIKDGNKITEIAIVNFDGKEVTETFCTLINPERSIPYSITRLTGINNEMVTEAPKFYEVAKKIIELTEGRTFVAHNVFFDYQFLKREFSELGYHFNRPKLCTVRMGRKYLPGHSSYSLGKICKDLNIEIENRHRALGDAEATVELFKMILAKVDSVEANIVEAESKKFSLPSRLSYEEVDGLPDEPGVYYFYDVNGHLLYIGKSINIKKRVKSHFKVDVKNKRDLELKSRVARVNYTLTGNELAALLLENSEVKKQKPIYNRQLRYKRYNYGLFLDYSLRGEAEIRLRRKGQLEECPYLFTNKRSGKSKLNSMYSAILGIDCDSIHFENKKELFIKTLGIAEYNKIVEKVFEKKRTEQSNYTLNLPGRSREEKCCIVVNDRYPKSLRYFRQGDPDIISLHHDEEAKGILYRYLQKHNVHYELCSEEC